MYHHPTRRQLYNGQYLGSQSRGPGFNPLTGQSYGGQSIFTHPIHPGVTQISPGCLNCGSVVFRKNVVVSNLLLYC